MLTELVYEGSFRVFFVLAVAWFMIWHYGIHTWSNARMQARAYMQGLAHASSDLFSKCCFHKTQS